MRCPRCGNENSEQNRFCGMCGATLLAPLEAPAAQAQRLAAPVATATAEAPAVRPQASEPPRPAAPVAASAPSISGPSFLGLNDPPPRKRASLSLDSQGAPSSSNLDYLLDDEEEHKSSGAGKVLLILIALALAGGLGYLRWKNHGFGWLTSPNKPSASQTATAADDSSSAPAPTISPSTAPAQQPASVPQPSTPPVQPPAATSATTAAPATTNSAPDSAPGTAAPATTAAPDKTAATPPATTPVTKPPDTSNAAATDDKTQPPAQSSPPPTTPPTADAAAASPNTSDDAKPAPTAPAPKPHAAIKPVVAVDPVAEAQKYLYGHGVPQDCERGMRLLRPAANQSNPKAMVEMGALYSAGLCTPHDLPTAYRWFALALRKDPNNDAAQADLQKLWSEMTQAERQLAIKLTQ